MSIDRLSLKILARLLVDGRISFRQMAYELHTSTSTVSSRVSRLEKAGIIRGYLAAINSEALGYDITAVTEIRISKGKLFEMEGEIAKLPGVCAVYDVTGEIDGIVVSKFRKREELSRFTKGLLRMPFVEHANTHVVLATIREDFRVPLEPTSVALSAQGGDADTPPTMGLFQEAAITKKSENKDIHHYCNRR